MFTQGTIHSIFEPYLIKVDIDDGYAPKFRSSDFIMGYDTNGSLVGWNFPPDTGSGTGENQLNGFKLFQDPDDPVNRWTIDLSTSNVVGTSSPPTVATLWHGPTRPVVDMRIAVLFRKRGAYTISARYIADLVLKNIVVRSSGYGLLAATGVDDITLEDVRIEGPVGSLYTAATGVNAQSGRGTFTATRYYAEYLGDDVYNNNTRTWTGVESDTAGRYDPVVISADRKVVTAYFGTSVTGETGVPVPIPGDKIEIWPPNLSSGRYYNEVVSVDPNVFEELFDVTLRDPLPLAFEPLPAGGWYLFNRSQVQRLRLNDVESRACAGCWRVYSDDAIISGHKVTGHYGGEIAAFWPDSVLGNAAPNLVGYAGGLSVLNAVYSRNANGRSDISGGVGTYLLLGDAPFVEPTGKLIDAKPVTFANVVQDGHRRGGITIVGHDASLLSVKQSNMGAGRPGLGSVQNSDVYVSAGEVKLGFYEGGDPPYVTRSNTSAAIIRPDVSTMIIAPETDRFLSALATPPTAARARLYSDYIDAVKATGEWSKIRGLFLFAAADAATGLTSLANPTSVTVNHGAAHTADRGFQGNGANAWIDSGVAGVPADSDAVFAAIWSLSDTGLSTARDIGLTKPDGSATSGGFVLNARNGPVGLGANSMATRVNDTTFVYRPVPNSIGMFGFVRADAAKYSLYVNGAKLGDDALVARTASMPAGLNISFLRGAGGFSNRQLAFGVIGRAPANPDIFMAALHAATRRYLVGVGAVAV